MPAREIALAITADPDLVFDSLLERSLSAGAARGTRTPDPVITNDVLYQLSYCGGPCGASGGAENARAPDIGQRRALQEAQGSARSESCRFGRKSRQIGPNPLTR